MDAVDGSPPRMLATASATASNCPLTVTARATLPSSRLTGFSEEGQLDAVRVRQLSGDAEDDIGRAFEFDAVFVTPPASQEQRPTPDSQRPAEARRAGTR